MQIMKNKAEQNIQELGNNIKKCNIYVIRIPEEERMEKKLFKVIISNNFPKLMTDKSQIQESQRH